MTQTQSQSQSGNGQTVDAERAVDASSALSAPTLPLYPATGGFDELIGADGGARPAWTRLRDDLDRYGVAEINRRSEHARRLIRENGVTYNVYGDTGGADRPWPLDALPVVIGADEWTQVAAGISQRARVLDALLVDCYGPQRLLRSGLLPPAAIFPHQHFLRACHGTAVPGGRRLHLYACDLVRDRDGRWQVLADRAQSPGGAGYALENRIVLSRALHEAYRDTHVQRVASFFLALRQTLTNAAPRRRDNPRIVLLTPGPYNEAYFEHTYLARYLGYTLVEGGDLTVRDDTVYLKTLGGLQRVDVILRRQDDDYCDPLELRDDSALGVAGLVQAVRAGNVAVVNSLGSGLAENAALMPLLPAACRELFGEELLLPSTETLWGGDRREDICAQLDSLVIRPAFGGRGEPQLGRALDGRARAALLAQLSVRPHAFVAQRAFDTGTAPVWTGTGLSPQPFTLRAFAVANGDDYVVMPGGYGRTGVAPGLAGGPLCRSAHGHGAAKDVWVLSAGPVAPVTLLRSAGARVEFKRGSSDLPSRVADNFFWLGRYAERTEDTARLLRAIAHRVDDDPDTQGGLERSALMGVVQAVGINDPGASVRTVLARVVRDAELGGSVPHCLRHLRQSAFALRDRLSNDTWRIINQLEQEFAAAAVVESERAHDVQPALNRLITSLAALSGMGHENTTRGPGWRFLDLGRRLERALFTIELLRATLAEPPADLPAEALSLSSVQAAQEAALEAALDVADSAITYRTRYLASLQAPAVLDLLLTDTTNPRSCAYQLAMLLDHVQNLPREEDRALPSAAERLALGAGTWLRLVDPLELCKEDERHGRPALTHFIDHLASDLTLLSDAITTQYLSHAHAARNLTGA